MKRRNGFTLIEIMIVLAVLGILAALAVPRFSSSKEKAYVAAMIADLHGAAIHEELYASEHAGSYFSAAATPGTEVEGFRTSPHVTVILATQMELTPSGTPVRSWTGTARHEKSDKRCESRGGVINCTIRADQILGEIAK